MYLTLAAAAGLAGLGSAALLRRAGLRARKRSDEYRDFVRAARLLAPPGPIALVGDEEVPDHAFAHFYFGPRNVARALAAAPWVTT